MLAQLGARLAGAVAKIGSALLAAWFLIRHGKAEAHRKMAERSLRRAADANEIDEDLRGASDAELDELFRKSQE